MIFIISKLYGSLFSDDIVIEAENKQKAIRKFCEQEKIKYKTIVYDWQSYKKKKDVDGLSLAISIQPVEIKDGKKFYAYSKRNKKLTRGFYNIFLSE